MGHWPSQDRLCTYLPLAFAVMALECAVAAEIHMPEKQTIGRARRDRRQGKAASTQAGEFVREEMDHIREGLRQADAGEFAPEAEMKAAFSQTRH